MSESFLPVRRKGLSALVATTVSSAVAFMIRAGPEKAENSTKDV